MTEQVLTVAPRASLSEAARIMANRRVKRLPVVAPDGSPCIGVISRADVVKRVRNPMR